MKNKKTVLLVLLSVLALAAWSLFALRKFPITIFVLKASGKTSEAFKLQLYLDPRDPVVEMLRLTYGQKREGADILRKNDGEGLEIFSKNFGKYSAVVGVPGSEEGWPGYLGGGWSAFYHDPVPAFGNLRWADRLYFALCTRVPPPAPFSVAEIPVEDFSGTSSTPKNNTVRPVTTPEVVAPSKVVRVEIQNGCGITNAADWAARRLKGPGILITDTGNADHFHYSKTVVKSSAGLPVALEEAVERLGLSKESVEEVPSLSGLALLNPGQSLPVDVIVIIGRDFKKLKERTFERSRQR